MNFFAFSGLINALAATFLGIVVYIRDPRAPRNKIYGLYCLSIAVWSFFIARGILLSLEASRSVSSVCSWRAPF